MAVQTVTLLNTSSFNKYIDLVGKSNPDDIIVLGPKNRAKNVKLHDAAKGAVPDTVKIIKTKG